MEIQRSPSGVETMKESTALLAGERYTVKWMESGDTVEVTVNGRHYRLSIRSLGAGGYWFGREGRSVEAIVSEAGQGFEITLGGHRFHVEFPDSGELRRSKSSTHGGISEIRAPMPGKIVRVMASAGDDVLENQGIVVMEAMKMQNEIRSPKSGRILELRVIEGNAVGMGDLIARVE